MKRRSAAMLLAILFCLTGCGGIDGAKESTVTVNKEGVVTEALIEEFLSENYDAEELEASIKELADTYNEEIGKEAVKIMKIQVKEGVATALLQYGSDDVYREFNQVDFFAGTVGQAKEEGYTFAGTFQDVEGKEIASGTVLDSCTDQQVIIIREPLNVQVPGKILYVSNNMKILNNKQAKLEQDVDVIYENTQVTTKAFGYVIYSAK